MRKKETEKIDETVNAFNESLKDQYLGRSLEENVALVKALFCNVDIFRLRYIENTHYKKPKYCIVYCDGVVDSGIISENIIKPLMLSATAEPGRGLMDTLMNQVVQISETEKTKSLKDIVGAVSYGDTVLFADGSDEALILNTKHFTLRAIDEPDNEKNLIGPREGFTESLMTNLSLLRRKVCSHELKMKFLTLGKRTRTKICVCYMEEIVNKKILKELYRRLESIDIDAVLDSNYITELIKDAQLSPFRTTGYTERPDNVIGKLLEGRIALVVDGSPSVLTVPYLFIENFQSSEDYYLNYYYSSFARLLRMLAFFMTITVPGFYVAIVAFHHEMFPTKLLFNIAAERSSVPLPASIEAFVMLIIFDILRETGVRMPTTIGQALSIVGALVIGQAAVEAKLVAAPMIIIVALTGITSLLVPKMNAPIVYIRTLLLFFSSILGLFGLAFGLCVALVHVINMHSFGIAQVTLSGNLQFQEIKDTFIRAPWWTMLTRPKTIAMDKRRMRSSEKRL